MSTTQIENRIAITLNQEEIKELLTHGCFYNDEGTQKIILNKHCLILETTDDDYEKKAAELKITFQTHCEDENESTKMRTTEEVTEFINAINNFEKVRAITGNFFMFKGIKLKGETAELAKDLLNWVLNDAE